MCVIMFYQFNPLNQSGQMELYVLHDLNDGFKPLI